MSENFRKHTNARKILFHFQESPECSMPKRRKMDTTTRFSTEMVKYINKGFPKIDNLEYFPGRVLHKIFSYVDDTDLVHLADISNRFASLAKYVFREKYRRRYFIFDSEQQSQLDVYEAIFAHFGRTANLRAIEARHMSTMCVSHWLVRLIARNSYQLEKLKLTNCCFALDSNVDDILSRHMKMTHLIIDDINFGNLRIPNFQHLVELSLNEISNEIEANAVIRIVRMNPGLETLNLRLCGVLSTDEVLLAVAQNLPNIKKLDLLSAADFHWRIWETYCMDLVVNMLTQLESLAISVNYTYATLIKRLGDNCPRMKHLEVNFFSHYLSIIEEGLFSFKSLETLSIWQIKCDRSILSVASALPNLRHLSLLLTKPELNVEAGFVLKFNCPTLETVRIKCPGMQEEIIYTESFTQEMVDYLLSMVNW